MTKTMGTQYRIVANGNWNEISEIARVTKELVVATKPRGFSSVAGLEDHILTTYLTPKENESFADYKARFVEAFVVDGFKGAMASLLMGQKVSLNFKLAFNESTFLVDTVTRANKYVVTIDASGIYYKRGASIATDLKELLEQNQVQHTYKSIDRLI